MDPKTEQGFRVDKSALVCLLEILTSTMSTSGAPDVIRLFSVCFFFLQTKRKMETPSVTIIGKLFFDIVEGRLKRENRTFPFLTNATVTNAMQKLLCSNP